jgi:putative aldouronate transport system permease protein
MDHYKSRARTVFLIVNSIFLSLVGVLCLLPFVHLLAVSFSDNSAVAAGRVSVWPINFTLAAYKFAIQGGKFGPAMWMSVKRVLIGVSINIFLIVITAYPLSKPKEKLAGRNVYMTFFIATMIINGGLIPTYLLVVNLGLINSVWALVLPPVGSIGALPVFFMIIMMNFIRGLPQELEDAATIDGAGVFGILLRIMLPLLAPAIATVGLFAIVAHWNEWFGGLIYMQNPKLYPLQTYLRTLLRNFEDIIRMAQGDYAQLLRMLNVRTGRAAQLFLAMMPVLAVYPFLQKYFTTGLVLGSVKG